MRSLVNNHRGDYSYQKKLERSRFRGTISLSTSGIVQITHIMMAGMTKKRPNGILHAAFVLSVLVPRHIQLTIRPPVLVLKVS